MTGSPLSALAEAAGITARWTDAFGLPQTVPDDSLRALLVALGLPAATDREIRDSHAFLGAPGASSVPVLITAVVGEPVLLPSSGIGTRQYRIDCEDGRVLHGRTVESPEGHAQLPPVNAWGYHRLLLDGRESMLAVAPPRCFGVLDALGRERACGTAAQLYSLRREGAADIGDYRALQALALATARAGADFIAVSPVHALFAADATRYSPYAPSNRLFLNVLHVDAGALADLSGVAPAEAAAQTATSDLIDWPAIATSKLALLRRQFDALSSRDLLSPGTPTGQLFQEYRRDSGSSLERHAGFEALQATMLREDAAHWHWQAWPDDFRDPDSARTAAFMNAHEPDVAFHAFLQWRATTDLAAAQSAAKAAGMGLGLIADLAVGTDSAGSYTWGHQADLLPGVSVGAPPDLFNPLGQDWGLTTFSPHALRRTGFAPFVNLLRAAMRHAGGVRIDHILGLQRLWLVPNGVSSREGAYLAYPLQDLLRLVALESWRHRAVVVGEDLGTVPPGFRATLADVNVLGTRVLWFERDEMRFMAPCEWHPATLATSSTHDLPTIAGWWAGRDIDWRVRLGLLGADETGALLLAGRDADRARLWQALRDAGVASGEMAGTDEIHRVLDAVAAFVGATPCALAMLPLEDILGLIEQPNLPGTIENHPNWRHRLPVNVERIMDDPGVRSRFEALASTRLKS